MKHTSIVLTFLTAAIAAEQTNRFYVTYEPGVAFANTNVSREQIEKSKQAQESRPAEQDLDGHWGARSGGFQLSLRLERASFTNGEPILATTLLRNVSDKLLTYLVFSTHDPESTLVLLRGKERMSRRDAPTPDASFVEKLAAIRQGTIFHCPSPPETQRKFVADLSKVFDVTAPGEYTVFAVREIRDDTRMVITNVSSGSALFTVAAAPPKRR